MPVLYADCGESIPSLYCIRRKGYLKFGPESYKTVDYDNKCLSYQFKLNPDKDYRIDLSYYFSLRDTDVEFPKGDFSDDGAGDEIATPALSQKEQGRNDILAEGKDSTYTLVQQLKIDGVPLDLSYVKSGELKKVSIPIPCSLYADGVIIVDIEKVKRRYVVCGEIGICEFEHEEKKLSAGGAQEGEASLIPNKFFFGPVYPNPTRGKTKMRYGLDRPTRVKISVYDVSGRLVERIKDKTETAGIYEIFWDSKALAQGIYFIQFDTKKSSITRKIVLVK